MKMFIKGILIILIFARFDCAQNVKENLPRLSPKAYVGQSIGYTNVEINYSKPGVKDRTIWGELVPYDAVWRTGANEATTIEFQNDIYVEGRPVPAGKYSLFTIPTKEEWTIILNKVYEQWGAFKYNAKEDFLRFKVKPKKNHYVERLTFDFDYKSPYQSYVVFEWDELKFSFLVDSKERERNQ